MALPSAPSAQPASNGEARRGQILLAVQDGVVSVSELSKRLNVTESTIRRDLQRLERAQKIVRTYGGTMGVQAREAPTSQKAGRFLPEKDAIARWAADQVTSDETLLLDAGTTVGRLAQRLHHRARLTVIAAGMDAVLALRDADDIELILVGGRLRHVNQGVVGPFADLMLDMVHAKRAFLGAEGIDPLHGISCPTPEQSSLKWRMTQRAELVYVLADHSKIGHSPFNYWCPWPQRFVLVTDAGVSSRDRSELEAVPGCTVVPTDVAFAA